MNYTTSSLKIIPVLLFIYFTTPCLYADQDTSLRTDLNFSQEISRPDIFLQPYLGWELYYENRDKAVMLNRICVIKNINSNVSVGLYYRIDFSNINHQWECIRHLIGLQINIIYQGWRI